jgi:sialate O-acetylesterase
MRKHIPMLLLSGAAWIQATVAMKVPFGNHMVLQRNQAMPVWGTAANGESVTVTLNAASKTVKAGTDGTWKVSLDAASAGGPFSLTAKGSANTVTYTDVMVGEVWHCAGQSNMDTRMGYWEYPNLTDSVKNANYPLLRYVTMRQPGQTVQWQNVTPSTVGALSAAGYFFGRDLLDNLKGVSVGLVVTAVGGTIIEQWLDPVTLSGFSDLAADTTAGAMYDTWVKPVAGYGVKGTVWLQGENNTSSALYKNYGKRLEKMIPGWRTAWGQSDMPFLVAGLCHKGPKQTATGETSNEASIRELQRLTTDTLKNAWMSVTVDLGSDSTWHYPQKPQLGKRLGTLARGALYGQTGFVYEHPRPKACFKRGSTIVIPWDVRGGKLVLDSGTVPLGFQVAGSNNVWSWASATLKGDTVFLTTTVASPTQVRHAWANQPIMNLRSSGGQPATPFAMTIAATVPVGIVKRREERPSVQLLLPGLKLQQGVIPSGIHQVTPSGRVVVRP